MAETLDARVNARVPKRVKDDLESLSRRRRIDESELTRTLLDEGLRRERHAGVVFRPTAKGREAAIEGRRLYVWQVITTIRDNGGRIDDAAGFLGLRLDQVQAAVTYYDEFRSEIEAEIDDNEVEADRVGRPRGDLPAKGGL